MSGQRNARLRADHAAAALGIQHAKLRASRRRLLATLERREPALLVGGGFLLGVLLVAPTRGAARVVARLATLTGVLLRSPLLHSVLIPVVQTGWPGRRRQARKAQPGAS